MDTLLPSLDPSLDLSWHATILLYICGGLGTKRLCWHILVEKMDLGVSDKFKSVQDILLPRKFWDGSCAGWNIHHLMLGHSLNDSGRLFQRFMLFITERNFYQLNGYFYAYLLCLDRKVWLVCRQQFIVDALGSIV